MKKTNIPRTVARGNRLIRERVHDPYKARLKPKEPTICRTCGAVFRSGRWQWAKIAPSDATEALCQACHRIADNYPAGEVTLNGRFLDAHRQEILNLAHNVEKSENSEHPLNRIMDIDQSADRTVITTTDIHLPRRIGQAIFDAWEGDLDFHYDEEGYFIRVDWRRDE